MATIRQQKLARAIVDNFDAEEPLNLGELVESVGYSKTVAEAKPGEIIEQKGVQYELRRLGFDEDNAKRVVGEILNDDGVEPQHRLKAAEQVFKVTGAYAPEKSLNLNVEVETDSVVRELTQKLNGVLRGAQKEELNSEAKATS